MKVFITTSGTGSRLFDLTKYTNKSMIKIGKKPVISYIIDEYPEDTEFVISLGYFGDHIKQFLTLAYPDKKFTFVYVDKYEGPGSSQVYSQLQAEKYLQEPFIYHDCDTIIENLQSQIPMKFNYNFMVGYETNAELYDAFDYDVQNMNIIKTHMKPDSLNGMLAYVGIVGVYDYKEFWNKLHLAYENETVPHDFLVYHKYDLFKNNLKAIKINNWTDTGNVAGVKNARKNCKDKFNILDKNDQAIFVINNKVLKFFARNGMVDRLLNHYRRIEKFVMPIKSYSDNFICYDWKDAENAIDRMNPIRFKALLDDLHKRGLWKDQENLNDATLKLFEKCKEKFYLQKNIDRVEEYKNLFNISEDKDIYVNDILIPKKYTIAYMLNEFSKLPEFNNIKISNWHGDFTLDNIIFDAKTKNYTLLDWRDSFGNIVEYGDKFYDFGKMLHNINLNFNSVYNELYDIIEEPDNSFWLNIQGNTNVLRCEEVLKEFIHTHYPEVRWEFIEMIAGMCWVSMASLHALDPISKWLFYNGKLMMYKNLIKLI